LKWLLMIVLLTATPVLAQSETICEAVAIYEEANTESAVGKRGVLDVIRFRGLLLGKSSCGVVKARGQFSWYHRGYKWKVTQDILTDWRNTDKMPVVLEGAYYFNSGKRIRKYRFYKRIGAHNFYYRK